MSRPDAKDYSLSRATILSEGYKGLLVVNGGGAVALLSFISQIVDKSPRLAQSAFIGVAIMAVGLFLALLIPFLRYHHSHAAQKLEAADRTQDRKTSYFYTYIFFQYASAVVFLIALAYLVTTAFPVVSEVPIKKCSESPNKALNPDAANNAAPVS